LRLNRYLSVSGCSSRRKGEEAIRAGRVAVNGEAVLDPAFDVAPGADRVTLDGGPLEVSGKRRYILLNKPVGVIVSRGDTHGRITVFDLLGGTGKGVFPAGRLDTDTSGALLLTDDGDLAFRLTHPSFGVEKVYRAVVKGEVTREDVRKMERGIMLDDGPTAPASMLVLGRDQAPQIVQSARSGPRSETSTVELTLHQGRKRQVRRMFDRIGHPVISLERISFGGITIEGVPPGVFRPLDDEEAERLRASVSL